MLIKTQEPAVVNDTSNDTADDDEPPIRNDEMKAHINEAKGKVGEWMDRPVPVKKESYWGNDEKRGSKLWTPDRGFHRRKLPSVVNTMWHMADIAHNNHMPPPMDRAHANFFPNDRFLRMKVAPGLNPFNYHPHIVQMYATITMKGSGAKKVINDIRNFIDCYHHYLKVAMNTPATNEWPDEIQWTAEKWVWQRYSKFSIPYARDDTNFE
jgi:hypothetical protein